MSSVFHFTPSPYSSIELEHASPHRSTPGTLSACPVSLSWSLHPPVWSGKVVLWASHRWYLGVTWYFSSPPMGGNFFTFPQFQHVWLIISSWQSTSFSSYPRKSHGRPIFGTFHVCVKIDLFYSCIWLTIQPGTGLQIGGYFPSNLGVKALCLVCSTIIAEKWDSWSL